MDWKVVEGVARDAVLNIGFSPEESLVDFAHRIGITVIPGRRFSYMAECDTIVNASASVDCPRDRIRLAHEIGHALLKRAGEDYRSERMAWMVGAALLMPEEEIKARLSSEACDLPSVAKRYNVSLEALARRVTDVLSSVARIWDNGKLSKSIRSPWLKNPSYLENVATDWESSVATSAVNGLRSHEQVHVGVAKSLSWTRVVIVTPIEHWESLTFPNLHTCD